MLWHTLWYIIYEGYVQLDHLAGIGVVDTFIGGWFRKSLNDRTVFVDDKGAGTKLSVRQNLH
jgi:hypothetical protein